NDITKKVEANLGLNLVKTIDVKKAKAQKSVIMHDYTKSYIAFLRKYLDLKTIKSARFKILTDVMHGSGGRLMEEILKGTKLRLTLTREDVNPIFDGLKPEPIAEYVAGSLQRVKKEKFDIGLILDGDADRIGAIAPGGEFVNPQRILGLIILHLYRNRGRRGGIVKTICGTTMLDNIARKLKLKLHETPVGFKYISDLMVSERVIAGGEEAGGVGVQDYIPERDGSLAGLLLVEMMVYNKKNLKQLLAEMEKEFGRYYYLRSDAHLGDKPADLSKFKAVSAILGKKVVDRKDYDGLKLICEDESWVMWRPSGTEPLVRVYAEAKSLKRAQELIKF
ncbi:MAG: phosphoesterase, partial [Candidatus Omnitrophica bacterium CG12_big_fil_rev_8_21_14_0_65_50_5]